MKNKILAPNSRHLTVSVKLDRDELAALQRLMDVERLPASQVLRRLIWTAVAVNEIEPSTSRKDAEAA